MLDLKGRGRTADRENRKAILLTVRFETNPALGLLAWASFKIDAVSVDGTNNGGKRLKERHRFFCGRRRRRCNGDSRDGINV